MANFEYLGPQFTVHLNVKFRFCKKTPQSKLAVVNFLLLALFVHEFIRAGWILGRGSQSRFTGSHRM